MELIEQVVFRVRGQLGRGGEGQILEDDEDTKNNSQYHEERDVEEGKNVLSEHGGGIFDELCAEVDSSAVPDQVEEED